MDPITVLTFNNMEPAIAMRRRLREAGIPAEIYDESQVQKYWFLSKPLASIRLQVNHPDYERARHLLADWIGEGALREAIHCPECGGSRVEYPQFSRKFILPAAGALLCAVGLIQREFYCQECQWTWPLKPKSQPQTDPLGWPVKPPPPKQHKA